jgi:hypothetical protein
MVERDGAELGAGFEIRECAIAALVAPRHLCRAPPAHQRSPAIHAAASASSVASVTSSALRQVDWLSTEILVACRPTPQALAFA